MAIVLKLDTKASLFEPVEVEIDGKVYRVKEVTLGSLEKIQELQTDLNAGSAAAIRRTLEALIEGDISVVRNLQLSKLRKLVEVLIERSINPAAEEKNASGPGGESLPS
jgi:hypothetical protein